MATTRSSRGYSPYRAIWDHSITESCPSKATPLKCEPWHGLLKNIITKGPWHAASALEGRAAIKISQKTILKVAEAVTVAENEVVQVDWIDQEIGRILKA